MADVRLTGKEQEKAAILKQAITGEITNHQAAKELGLSVRQIQRVKARVRELGDHGVIHQLKGKSGNHRFTDEKKEQVIETIRKHYGDFKPTFATEKLAENHALFVSRETTRLWLIERGLWKVRKQKYSQYRSWRPRKEYFGELEQFDGSYHLWFENRFVDGQGNSIEVCLLAAIDDATGRITRAEFLPNEGVIAVFTFWKGYVQELGKPLGIYLDKFSTYKINHKAAVDNPELLTQFQRVMKELGTTLILANSPQAKGRIERLFQTLQDRLVKEMRLAKINTPEEGNTFLRKIFLPKFNAQFSVIPTREGDAHRILLPEEKEEIDHIFSIHDTRKINLDFTIQFKNDWYQLTEIQPTTLRPLMRVVVETWLDGTIHLTLNKHELSYLLLPEKPKKQRIKQPAILTTHTLHYKPPPNHPWRNRILPEGG